MNEDFDSKNKSQVIMHWSVNHLSRISGDQNLACAETMWQNYYLSPWFFVKIKILVVNPYNVGKAQNYL
jgi:hypothetical protein